MVWIAAFCLAASFLTASFFGMFLVAFGEGRYGIPLPVFAGTFGGYALVIVCIVWLCRLNR